MAPAKGPVTSLLEMRIFSSQPNPDEKLGEEAEKFIGQIDQAREKGIPREEALGAVEKLIKRKGV